MELLNNKRISLTLSHKNEDISSLTKMIHNHGDINLISETFILKIFQIKC